MEQVTCPGGALGPARGEGEPEAQEGRAHPAEQASHGADGGAHGAAALPGQGAGALLGGRASHMHGLLPRAHALSMAALAEQAWLACMHAGIKSSMCPCWCRSRVMRRQARLFGVAALH